MNAPFSSCPSTPADSSAAPEVSAAPGRPSGYSERILEMLKSVVRECGVSDSAAAIHLGMGASTLSDWKRAHPEIRLALQQAREAFRAGQLRKIMAATQAEAGRGWRAAAWLLERVFPADYARTAQERSGHERREERLAEREEREEQEARLAELRARNTAAAASGPVQDEEPFDEEYDDEEYEEGEEGVEEEEEEEEEEAARAIPTPQFYSETPFGNSGNVPPSAAPLCP